MAMKFRVGSSFPYQNWCAFEPDQMVRVYNAYGDVREGPAKSFWWGYEEEMGQIGDGVIIKAEAI